MALGIISWWNHSIHSVVISSALDLKNAHQRDRKKKATNGEIAWKDDIKTLLLAPHFLRVTAKFQRSTFDGGDGKENVKIIHMQLSKWIISARLAREFFILIHFFAILCETMASNDHIWTLAGNVSTRRLMLFFSLTVHLFLFSNNKYSFFDSEWLKTMF